MISFAELLKADNEEIINIEEFGEVVTIDGVILHAQIDNFTQKKSTMDKKNFRGLHGDFTTIYFRTSDYCGKRERIPVQGEIIHVNGKRYTVESSRDESGITTLEIDTYRQGQLRQGKSPGTFRLDGGEDDSD